VHRLLPFLSRSLNDVQLMMDNDNAVVLALQVIKVANLAFQQQQTASGPSIVAMSVGLRQLACEFLEKLVKQNASVAIVLFREIFCSTAYRQAFLAEGYEDLPLFSVLTTMFQANVDLCATVVCNRLRDILLNANTLLATAAV